MGTRYVPKFNVNFEVRLLCFMSVNNKKNANNHNISLTIYPHDDCLTTKKTTKKTQDIQKAKSDFLGAKTAIYYYIRNIYTKLFFLKAD